MSSIYEPIMFRNSAVVLFMVSQFKDEGRAVLLLRSRLSKTNSQHLNTSLYLKNNSQSLKFVNEVIEQMGTLFTSPEQLILIQGNVANSMFFMAQGGAIVIMGE